MLFDFMFKYIFKTIFFTLKYIYFQKLPMLSSFFYMCKVVHLFNVLILPFLSNFLVFCNNGKKLLNKLITTFL